MSLASEIIGRRMGLPRAQTHAVLHERDLVITADDGVRLLADRWVARRERDRAQPTVLVRSPYGRRALIGLLLGRLLAERGLQVVIGSVRGTFGSGGTFSPFDERADGLATLRWIRAQPWHTGAIGMIGPSYLGLVQWAVAPEAGDDLAALAIQASASQFHGQTYSGGSLSLETAASWLAIVAQQERRFAPLLMARTLRRLPRLLGELPLSELDTRATGEEVAWFREAMAHPTRQDGYWAARDFARGVREVAAQVQLVGGWYDIFLPWLLEDFHALQEAGRAPQLVVGPWTHTDPALMAAGLREGLGWLRGHLLGDRRLVRDAAVRLRLTGAPGGAAWREYPTWPPPGTTERRLWLHRNGRLHDEPPAAPAAGAPLAPGGDPEPPTSGDRYRYDPRDPTPSLGGPVLLAREPVVENRPLEARDDVLVYTTDPLADVHEAVGPVRAELWARVSEPHVDLFARVCDVDPAGASWNVCDALVRLSDATHPATADGARQVVIDLWPIAHRFARGHRIRLQVSSGAHPRYARNSGTGEDPMTARELRAVEVEILRDTAHPSVLVLPAQGAAAP